MACGEPDRRPGVQRGQARGAVSENVLGVRPGVACCSSAFGSLPGVSGEAPSGAEAVSSRGAGRIEAAQDLDF
jgi:hypothetical protein